jgi:hypothetical protein
MTTITSTYEIRPIDADVVAALRDCDDAGRRPRIVMTHDGGSPLRCCLRRSSRDEPMALASYAPLRRWAHEVRADPSAYDEVGPVFIHPDACNGPADDGFPAELFEARRVLRAYSADGAILGGRLIEAGERAEQVLVEMFTDPQVAVVHARALEFGCFMFEARRVRVGRRP